MSSLASSGYRLLDVFRSLFLGVEYRPRRSTQGDAVAIELYEDLYDVARARTIHSKYVSLVDAGQRVVNPKNRTVGVTVRRGDGTFGEIVPQHSAIAVPHYRVRRAENAFAEIGCEVKILATAQQRQARRVENDLRDQVNQFHHRGSSRKPITVAIVGVNHSPQFCSIVGRQLTMTDGRGATRHPIQEAASAESTLNDAWPLYDHHLLVRYKATNQAPYPFEFVSETTLKSEYGALLARLAGEYEARF